MYTSDWVVKEFSDAPLADSRLISRLVTIADKLYSNPESSIPMAFKSYSATRATYRFFNNKKVSPEAILMSHREQTIERMKHYDTVLIIQDTTPLDYRTHTGTKGLGNYAASEGALGLLNHTALAVSTEGVPLGILSRYVWTRIPEEYGKKHTRKKRETAEKESQRWLDTLDTSTKSIPSYVNAVTVCDREADIYDFFHKAISKNKHLLVRVAQNRAVLEEGKQIIQEISCKPVMGQMLVSIPRDAMNKRPPREATLSIKYCPVTVKPPHARKKSERLPNLELYLIFAEEINPPQGVEPVSWLLLTTMPVESLEQAVEKIKWYKQRWKIERYHLVLKSGCKVEELQFETSDTLQNALALYAIIAWKLLWIKYESEENPEASCDKVLQEHEWQALYCIANQTSVPPTKPPTLEEAVLMIAKLGGFLGRKCDGKPGVIVIWRGLMCLNFAVQGWLAAKLLIPSQ